MHVHQTINEIVQEDMRRSGLLQGLGIDTCCGGQRTLSEACAEIGLDPEDVLKQLIAAEPEDSQESSATAQAERDWSQSTLSELIDHIESTHHQYLKSALPRLSSLIGKVRSAHEVRHPELKELESVFQALKADLEPHMMKEEQVLFPAARKLDTGEGTEGFHCGSLQAPIRVMLSEHERVDGLLKQLPETANQFAMPEDGCGSYREMLDELKTLKTDLESHIQKENEILFPMILEEEQDSMP
ncbi:MAG: iron-sulfur cluster repair di-iron protein [Nitrospinaceae bacterium]